MPTPPVATFTAPTPVSGDTLRRIKKETDPRKISERSMRLKEDEDSA